ncbi:P-type ATPase [Enterobacter hormaechei]
MLSSEARVIRNGNHGTIPTTEIVPGDIIVLRAGMVFQADMRLIEAHNLRVEEAILTGESTVVDKHTNPLSGELPLGDRTNLRLFRYDGQRGRRVVGVVIASGPGDRTRRHQPDDGGR